MKTNKKSILLGGMITVEWFSHGKEQETKKSKKKDLEKTFCKCSDQGGFMY